MKKSLLFLFALLLGVVAFQSCSKDDNTTPENADMITSEDIAESEDLDQQIDADADIAIEERGGGNACPTVTMTQPYGTWPNTITIDYGAACERPDGRVLKGKIIINQTADIFTVGAVRTRTFDGFAVDDVQFEGTKVWTNNGQNAAGQWSYTKVASGIKHTFADGTARSWNATHTSTLTAGGNTLNPFDDVWSTTGSATGANRKGVDFSVTITEPLIKTTNCRWISAGVMTFTRGDRTSSLDFGDGGCDRFGELTNNAGDTFTIRLRR